MALVILYFAWKTPGPARTPALLAGACFALGFLVAVVSLPNIKAIHMDLCTLCDPEYVFHRRSGWHGLAAETHQENLRLVITALLFPVIVWSL